MNGFDAKILVGLNHFAGRSPTAEAVANLLVDCDMVKGLAFIVILWHFWLLPDRTRRAAARRVILATLAAAIVAIGLGRLLATCLPFRVRPVFNPALGLRPHLLTHAGMRAWSAFPSDHAMLFAALSTGIWFLSPWLGVATFAYALAVIDLPRVYFGLHHPTDVIGGAILGVAVGVLFNRPGPRDFIADRAKRLQDGHRRLFYALFACLSAEIMTMFAEPRAVVTMLVELARAGR